MLLGVNKSLFDDRSVLTITARVYWSSQVATSDASNKPNSFFEPSCGRTSEYGQRVGASQSETRAADGHIETVSGSDLLLKPCSRLRMWARRRETRQGIEVVFRMKSSAPASSEAVS